jgi:hypothetical protein
MRDFLEVLRYRPTWLAKKVRFRKKEPSISARTGSHWLALAHTGSHWLALARVDRTPLSLDGVLDPARFSFRGIEEDFHNYLAVFYPLGERGAAELQRQFGQAAPLTTTTCLANLLGKPWEWESAHRFPDVIVAATFRSFPRLCSGKVDAWMSGKKC